MRTTANRPIAPLRGRDAAKHKAMAKAVKDLVFLRKTNPAAYEELIKKYADQPIRIVPG